eukprot:12252267-Alexandrium_andersonii.AAC.1
MGSSPCPRRWPVLARRRSESHRRAGRRLVRRPDFQGAEPVRSRWTTSLRTDAQVQVRAPR